MFYCMSVVIDIFLEVFAPADCLASSGGILTLEKNPGKGNP